MNTKNNMKVPCSLGCTIGKKIITCIRCELAYHLMWPRENSNLSLWALQPPPLVLSIMMSIKAILSCLPHTPIYSVHHIKLWLKYQSLDITNRRVNPSSVFQLPFKEHLSLSSPRVSTLKSHIYVVAYASKPMWYRVFALSTPACLPHTQSIITASSVIAQNSVLRDPIKSDRGKWHR